MSAQMKHSSQINHTDTRISLQASGFGQEFQQATTICHDYRT